MPNLGSVFKGEILRLSRKAQKEDLRAVQKTSAGYRRQIAQLKRDVAGLRRDVARLQKGLTSSGASTRRAADKTDDATPLRFQVRGLKSLRARLGLSAEDFGALAGVSGQTIYNWESEKATPRKSQIAKLAAVRKLGKREAQAQLAARR